jgi:signal transduction histidine kinase/ActR/RegA family two-component response regulator
LQLTYFPQFQFAGYYAADLKGFYRDQGLRVTFIDYVPGEDVYDAVVFGRADFGVSNTSIFTYWAAGKDLFLIALIHQSNPAVMLVRSDSPYNSLEDVIDLPRQQMIGPAVRGEIEFAASLRALGRDPEKFFSRNKLPEDFERFVSGEIEVLSGYRTNEPFMLKRRGIETRALSLHSRRMVFPGNGLVCHGETWRTNPDLVEAFRAASLKGWEYAIAHSEELVDHILEKRRSAIQALERQTLMDGAHATIDLIDAERIPIGTINIQQLNAVAGYLRDAGIQAQVPEKQVYQPRNVYEFWLRWLSAVLALFALSLVVLAQFTRRQRRFLLESQLHYRNLVDLAEGYFAFRVRIAKNRRPVIDLASPSIGRILGHTMDYYRTHQAGFLMQIPAEDRNRVNEQLEQAIRLVQPLRLSFSLLNPSHDRLRRLLIHAIPISTDQGLSFDGICIDLTSEAEAEDERQELHKQLEVAHRHESLGLLASGVAHDFNNLLGAVRGNAELLSPLVATDDIARHRLERLLLAVDRAAGLVRQILAYSGKGAIEAKPLNLEHEIRQLRALMKHGLPEKIRVHLDIEPHLPPVLFDQIQFQQVLLNLLVNAADSYEGREGTVIISLGRDHNELLCLQVIDEGCGMSKATMDRMFEPYYTTKARGHGLGLAAVQGIIKKVGGTLECKSEQGKGTTFTVLLKATAELVPHPRYLTPPEIVVGKRAILVVDDDDLVRESTVAMLQGIGYPTREARGGKECLKLMEEQRQEFSAIVLDCRMPDVDGPNVLRALRAKKDRIPVILVSGMTTTDDYSVEFKDRRTRFLAKPFTQAQLSQMMTYLFGSGHDPSEDSDTITGMFVRQMGKDWIPKGPKKV